MSRSISCTVKQNSQVEKILEDLRLAGFSNQNVSLLFPDRIDTKKWIQAKVAMAPGILGWLASGGSLTIPGIGTFIASGPLLVALSDASINVVMSGVTGALVSLGMPEYEAVFYENKIKAGLILISAHTEDSEKEKRIKTRQIFKDDGASDISENGE